MASHGRRDTQAGALLEQMRRDRGLSPEGLSHALHAAGHGYVSGKTIRRVETGAIPTVRVQFALAQFFDGRLPSQVWVPRAHRMAA